MIRPDMTEAILRCISSHLSARRGCREIEYKVNIYGNKENLELMKNRANNYCNGLDK
mgnify:CR=1 FL=1